MKPHPLFLPILAFATLASASLAQETLSPTAVPPQPQVTTTSSTPAPSSGFNRTWAFQPVDAQVVDEQGKPAAGITVFVVGLERDALGLPREIAAESDGVSQDRYNGDGWKFKTDQEGRFSARFGKFRAHEYQAATGESAPGEGGFYFVTRPEGYAGGVSPYLQNGGNAPQTEWTKGAFAPVNLQAPGRNGTIVIRLRGGITVSGQVLDGKGKPIAGEKVFIYHDLHSDSHTGRGGEIFPSYTTTDAKGRYTIDQVYPNRFYLRTEGPAGSPNYWFKTRVNRGKWEEKQVDSIQPAPGAREIGVDFVMSARPPYHYWGRVTDAAGMSVPGAEVSLHFSHHWPHETWEDDHSSQHVLTDANGNYQIRLETPYVYAIAVKATGFAPAGAGQEATTLPPGPYVFTLTGTAASLPSPTAPTALPGAPLTTPAQAPAATPATAPVSGM